MQRKLALFLLNCVGFLRAIGGCLLAISIATFVLINGLAKPPAFALSAKLSE